jgi:hypothetical protein
MVDPGFYAPEKWRFLHDESPLPAGWTYVEVAVWGMNHGWSSERIQAWRSRREW